MYASGLAFARASVESMCYTDAWPQDKCFVKRTIHKDPADRRRTHHSVAGT